MIMSINLIKKVYILFGLAITSLSFAEDKPQMVVDLSALHAAMEQRQDSLTQWAIQNQKDVEKLQALEASYNLELKNSTKHNIQTWEHFNSINSNTQNLLKASAALWDEYGNANLYIATFKKSDYWQQCLAHNNCQSKESMQYIDEKSIDFATKAYLSADVAKDNLQNQLEILESIFQEAQASQGYGDNLDAIAKINSQTAISLQELNAQISTMLQLLSHDLASNNSKKVAISQNSNDFLHVENSKAKEVQLNYSKEFKVE